MADEKTEKTRAVDTAISQIEKQFGEGAIMPLGSDKAVQIEGISTGSLAVDIALGGQGIPRGRIIEDAREAVAGALLVHGRAHGGDGSNEPPCESLLPCRAVAVIIA